jgi:hypothetical protein
VRPPVTAGGMPRYRIPTGWVDDEPVAKRTRASVKRKPSQRACGARPSGGAGLARMAVRGKVGDDAEGVFSEGRGLRARMARPYLNRGTT